MFCTQRHRGKLQLPTRAPGRSHHVLARGHNTQKKAPAYFLTGFFVPPHESTKAEECYYYALRLHHPYMNQGALYYSGSPRDTGKNLSKY